MFIAPYPSTCKLGQDTIKRILVRLKNVIAPNKIYFLKSPIKQNHIIGIKKIINLSDSVSLYMGEKSSNVNRSGLLILVNGDNKTEKQAILTADHHWLQIAEFNKKINNLPLLVVTPHHGGEAGRFESTIKNIIKRSGFLKLCTSCYERGNSYGHPRNDLLAFIENPTYAKKIEHKRTDIALTNNYGQDISYQL